jgi:RHS repeat-associated protein
VDGTNVGTYTPSLSVFHNGSYNYQVFELTQAQVRTYFFGKKLFITEDNVGSAESNGTFYPYGEPKTGNTSEAYGFATYWQDSESGLNYAMNRYYSSTLGRFLSPDPSGSMNRANPQSLNRYAYVQNDPVNHSDPSGLLMVSPPGDNGGAGGLADGVDCNTNPYDDPWDAFEATGTFMPFVGQQAFACLPFIFQNPEFTANASSGGRSTSGIVQIKNLSTTSSQALDVQNDLRWLQQAIAQDSDCSGWLQGFSAAINYMLDAPGSGATMMAVGVGSFGNNADNAVEGSLGTNLPSGMLITVNVNGAFFNAGPSTAVGFGLPSWIQGGSAAAQGEILLHELGHVVNASGMQSDKGNNDAEARNNQLVMQHCGDIVNALGGN